MKIQRCALCKNILEEYEFNVCDLCTMELSDDREDCWSASR